MASGVKGPARIELPVPLPIRSVNAWLWPGAEPVLLDCGTNDGASYPLLLAGVRSAGVNPSCLRLFVTHGHADHAGNAARLRQEHGVGLWAMREERPWIATFRSRAAERYGKATAALRMHGVPDAMMAAMQRHGEHLDGLMQDVEPAGTLAHNDRVVLGDAEARVHAAPGHTLGSLIITDGNDVASGDTLLERITSNAIELLESERGRYATYLRTLEGLRRYVGCRILPGHHAPFVLSDSLLDHHLKRHHDRSKHVLDTVRGAPKTAWQVAQKVLPHLKEDQAFLGVCEVVGHLHALEAAGAVSSRNDEGTRTFAARE